LPSLNDDYDAYCRRRLDVEQRIFRRGYISWGFLPGVTTEQLERFADHLDAEVAAEVEWY